MVDKIIAHDPHAPWDAEQEELLKEYWQRLNDAFEDMPKSGRLYFAHAAAALRQLAGEMDPDYA